MADASMAASEHAIDVWLAFYDEIVDERLLLTLHGLLSEAERRRQQRFHFADDRKRDLVTRAMVRTVLSRCAAVAPADWLFRPLRTGARKSQTGTMMHAAIRSTCRTRMV